MKRSLDVSGISFDLAVCSRQQDGGFTLRFLPVGGFRPADGRRLECGQWNLTPQKGRELAAALNAKKTPIVIDYEHQTLNAEKNGKEAPASGWCRPGSWSMGDDGLQVCVDWTAKASKMIDDKEYRFFSPVFTYDKRGNVTGVLHGALTNDPALDGFSEVFARAAAKYSYEDDPMKYSEMLAKLLGLPADASEDQITVALTALHARIEQDGQSIAAASRTITAVLDLQGQSVAALKAKADSPDANKFVPIAVLTASQQALATAQGEIAQLRASNGEGEVERLVKEGLDDGRILAATKDYWIETGKKDIAALKNWLNTAPKVAALSRQQTSETTREGGDAAALTDDERAACKAMGVAEDVYIKTRDKKKEGAK